ncbi:MAG: hypothetical protein ACTSRI_19370 [Promethearchaeota archaeon]
MIELDKFFVEFKNKLKNIEKTYKLFLNNKNSELNESKINNKRFIERKNNPFYQISSENIDNPLIINKLKRNLSDLEDEYQFIIENENNLIIILKYKLKLDYVKKLLPFKSSGDYNEKIFEKNIKKIISPNDLVNGLIKYKKNLEKVATS